MKRGVGLWIDHRQAVIVILTDKGEETKANKIRHGGTCPVFWRLIPEGSAEDARDRQFADQLSKYYDDVVACIRDTESILIFGPGEAKDELQKRLESKELGGRIVSVETVGKMTDRHLAAKVRQHFLKSRRNSQERTLVRTL
jgi:stalled ribosome rescue protein Dom34